MRAHSHGAQEGSVWGVIFMVVRSRESHKWNVPCCRAICFTALIYQPWMVPLITLYTLLTVEVWMSNTTGVRRGKNRFARMSFVFFIRLCCCFWIPSITLRSAGVYEMICSHILHSFSALKEKLNAKLWVIITTRTTFITKSRGYSF